MSLDDLAADCDRLRRALKITHWTVLAQSIGALTAIRYAVAHPDAEWIAAESRYVGVPQPVVPHGDRLDVVVTRRSRWWPLSVVVHGG